MDLDRMDNDRIADLLDPFLDQPLLSAQLDQISTYIDLLKHWSARINLTAIRNDEEIVTRHFGESLFLARHLFPSKKTCHPERSHDVRDAHVVAESKDPCVSVLPALPQGILPVPRAPLIAMSGPRLQPPRVIDIGSGAGFPALPVKIWASNIDLTLIESNHKKAAFLREVTRALSLKSLSIITDRAEAVASRVGRDFPQAEAVTLRAVENFETILPQAISFLAPRGSLALLIGASQIPHLTAMTTINWSQPIHIPKSHSRVLSIGVH